MMRPTWNRAISASARPRPRLKGGDPARNVEIARAVLAGEHGPPRDIVLVNAAAALMAAGKVATFLEGMAVAVVSIDSGAAQGKVDALARFRAGLAGAEAAPVTLLRCHEESYPA